MISDGDICISVPVWIGLPEGSTTMPTTSVRTRIGSGVAETVVYCRGDVMGGHGKRMVAEAWLEVAEMVVLKVRVVVEP